ncbi:MAG: hypothetical protein IJ435_08005 [Clostridia bacterium]|nr:hypothetical protein [Clostridia bacterium]
MRVVQMDPSSSRGAESFERTPFLAPSPKEKKNVFDPKAFKKDDWILIAIILALMLEGSEDYILLCALGYLFVMGL